MELLLERNLRESVCLEVHSYVGGPELDTVGTQALPVARYSCRKMIEMREYSCRIKMKFAFV